MLLKHNNGNEYLQILKKNNVTPFFLIDIRLWIFQNFRVWGFFMISQGSIGFFFMNFHIFTYFLKFLYHFKFISKNMYEVRFYSKYAWNWWGVFYERTSTNAYEFLQKLKKIVTSKIIKNPPTRKFWKIHKRISNEKKGVMFFFLKI